jgi:hypothetical protein
MMSCTVKLPVTSKWTRRFSASSVKVIGIVGRSAAMRTSSGWISGALRNPAARRNRRPIVCARWP